jgi:hypothetical protein
VPDVPGPVPAAVVAAAPDETPAVPSEPADEQDES